MKTQSKFGAKSISGSGDIDRAHKKPPTPDLQGPKKPRLNRVKAKKKGFRTLKMLYFLKIRLYLHTEKDYLTK